MAEQKLVVKHPSLKVLSQKQIKTTMYVKSKTPYISALKHINKLLGQLQRHGAEYVTVLGMGKASEKTLAVACYFQEEKGKKTEVLTQSVEVLDELTKGTSEECEDSEEDIQDEDKELVLRKRTISGVEVRIFP